MADVATAPTATADQTRAAGSRVLGYYLGSGGVKVDALHDVANFVTRNAAGQVALGGAALNYLFNLAEANPGRGILADIVNSASSDLNGAQISFTQNTITNNCFGMVGGSADMAIWFNRNIATDGTLAWRWEAGGTYRPGSDNSYSLGSGSFRVSVAYFGSNPIVTSDMREKTWRGAASAAELAAAKRIAAELGFYQWNDAVAEKGEDGARLHFGVRAQAVWAIMADEGLIDPIVEGVKPDSRYAFLCYDEWDTVEAVDEVRDEEGNVVSPAVPAQPGGNRFGVRPDQLALFLIAAQEARIAALEAAS